MEEILTFYYLYIFWGISPLFKHLLNPAYLQWYNGSTSTKWQNYINKHNPDSSFLNFLKIISLTSFIKAIKVHNLKIMLLSFNHILSHFSPFLILIPRWILFKSLSYFFLYLHARPSANPTVYYRYWQCMQYVHVI